MRKVAVGRMVVGRVVIERMAIGRGTVRKVVMEAEDKVKAVRVTVRRMRKI